MMLLLKTENVMGCNVTDVDLWIGNTPHDALLKNTDTLFKSPGCGYYWYIEWEAAEPDFDNFEGIVKFDGEEITTFECDAEDRSASGVSYVPSDATTGCKGVTVELRREGGSAWASNEACIWVVTLTVTGPSGDPTDPEEAEEGVNEFTFDGSEDGYCYIKCEAQITPANAETLAWAEDNIVWFTPSFQGCTKKCGDYNQGTFTEEDNKGLIVWIQYSGLPASNSAFGPQIIAMSATGIDAWERNIELFYSKNATNHPSDESNSNWPNWFYYWNDALVDNPEESHYEANPEGFWHDTTGGLVPAMIVWDPEMTYSKTEIWFWGNLDGESPEGLTGIDYFADLVKHEKVHIQQIQDADALLGTLNGLPDSIWEKGWAWIYPSTQNNHWKLGSDTKAGVANVNDDSDAFTDEVDDLSEIGYPGSDDVDLDEDDDDVPDTWDPADGDSTDGSEWIESQATAAQNTVNGENASLDWGNPGKSYGDGSYE